MGNQTSGFSQATGGDSSKKETRRRLSPTIRFVLLFLIMLLVVGIIFSQLFTRFHDNMLWLMRMTASISGAIVSIFSGDVHCSGVFVTFRGFTVEIIDECTGLFEMLIFIAAVFSFSTTFRKKLLGLALGLPAIFIFNIIRIMVLLVVGAYSMPAFNFMHLYFWQATLIIMISSLWVGWLYLVVYREKKSLAVSS